MRNRAWSCLPSTARRSTNTPAPAWYEGPFRYLSHKGERPTSFVLQRIRNEDTQLELKTENKSGVDTASLHLHKIANELNTRVQHHPVGGLQGIRAELKSLTRRPGHVIFSSLSTTEEFAFHHGGRPELRSTSDLRPSLTFGNFGTASPSRSKLAVLCQPWTTCTRRCPGLMISCAKISKLSRICGCGTLIRENAVEIICLDRSPRISPGRGYSSFWETGSPSINRLITKRPSLILTDSCSSTGMSNLQAS